MGQSWLLVTVSTPGALSTLRVHVWRRLRSLGALYLQQSVCLLPDRPRTAKAVEQLADRVGREGGDARVLRIHFTDPAQETTIVEAFRDERADEYQEVLSRVPDFLEEIESERAKGRFTYAEVEESEADLERFRKWLGRIAARDYFDAPSGTEARDAVERCATALAEFTDAALAAQDPQPSAALRSSLRAVRDESA